MRAQNIDPHHLIILYSSECKYSFISFRVKFTGTLAFKLWSKPIDVKSKVAVSRTFWDFSFEAKLVSLPILTIWFSKDAFKPALTFYDDD